MFKNRFLRGLAESVYALVVMIAIGKWTIYMAYLERGYEAIGGEYCLMIMAYWVAWKIIHYLFDALEDLDYGRKCKEKGS